MASGITGSASPYAKEKVWRPATARNGKWTLEAGQDAGSMRYEGMRLENMPDQLKDRQYYEYGPNKIEQAAKKYWDAIKESEK